MTSADALLGVINDILDFSKIEVGKLDIEPIPFRPAPGVSEETAAMMRSRAEEKGLDLIVRCAPECPHHVVGDPGRIRQVRGESRQQRRQIHRAGPCAHRYRSATQSAADDASLRFKVEDTGIGIDPDKIEHVFETFRPGRHLDDTALSAAPDSA